MLTRQPSSRTSAPARARKSAARIVRALTPPAALWRAGAGVALSAALLLSQTLVMGGARAAAAAAQALPGFEVDEEATAQVVRLPAQLAAAATVNFAALSAVRAASGGEDALPSALQGGAEKFVEPPPAPPEPDAGVGRLKEGGISLAKSARVGANKPAAKSGAKSGGVSLSSDYYASALPPYTFHAQSDPGLVAPPDASGAVGSGKVMSTHRSNYVVQNMAGAVLSSVPIEVFWAPTGAVKPYNPRALYDQFNHRWLLSAVSDARSPTSSVLVAVSQTSDPQGNFYLFRYDADGADALWADYPSLGFNKNWLVVSFNAHNVSDNTFNQGRVLALNYPALRAGTASAALFAGISDTNGGFTMQPAVTYSQTEGMEYLVSHIGSASGTYRVSAITGTPSDPTLFIGVQKQNGLGAWSQPGGEILPQAPPPAGGP
ncbi:MAG TPA: hypothetical protein VK421_18030, partial [Pyrinomonadaceae bacterium]|nr:hypothetical protein [Pyrinomonadaceae bacterium]